MLDGNKFFKFSTFIGTDKSSVYTGDLPIGMAGTKQDFVDGVKRLIEGNPYLELVLLLGFYGILAEELDKPDTILIINFYGDSSIGKSQSSLLPLSMFGQAQELFNSFNNTENKIEKQLSKYHIIPVVIDDVLVSYKGNTRQKAAADMAKLIIRFAAARDKGRLTEAKSKRYFSPVIMTSESSIGRFASNSCLRS